jgi:hypothetical protein
MPDADALAATVNERRLLGNALDLVQAMYDRFARGERLPDFNLDGDRGYGHLCWTQPGDAAPDFPGPLNIPVDLAIIR